MNFGTIFSIVETVISQAPKAWAVIKAGVTAFEQAADTKGKLQAIAAALDAAVQEIETILAAI